MITNVFSVYDLKAKAFMLPFFSAAKETGIRSFAIAVNDPTTVLSKHPEDFVLFQLGTFDDELGRLQALPQPLQLCMAAAVQRATSDVFQAEMSQATKDWNDQHGRKSDVRESKQAS